MRWYSCLVAPLHLRIFLGRAGPNCFWGEPQNALVQLSRGAPPRLFFFGPVPGFAIRRRRVPGWGCI